MRGCLVNEVFNLAYKFRIQRAPGSIQTAATNIDDYQTHTLWTQWKQYKWICL